MPLDVTHTDDGSGSHDPFGKHNTAQSVILFPVAERAVAWEGRDNSWHRANSHKAIVRVAPSGQGAITLGIVGANYKLVHNKELFSHVESTMCKEIPVHELAGVQVTDRVAGWGRTCFRQYVFPNIKCLLKGNVRSEIAFRLIVQNGYGGSALRIHAGAIDFYCTNGMIRGEYESVYRKHTSGVVVTGFGDTVRKALATFADSQRVWERWATTPVKHQAAMDLFRELASSERLAENLQDQYLRERDARGDSLWSVYSAMTYFASHNDGEFALRKSVNEQDSVAHVMLQRELRVSHWVQSDAWRRLEAI